MTIAIAILVGVAGHFWGPALGAWLAPFFGTWSGVAVSGIEAAAGQALNAAADLVPHGPLTDEEQATQRDNVERNRQEAFGPFG